MKNIITFFDFDGTLIKTPLPDKGKIIWQNYYKTIYPHLGWWGRSESLDLNVFDIIPNKQVYDNYLKFKALNNSYNTILTSRIYKLYSSIKLILLKNNIEMDEILCADNNLNKGERIVQQYKKMLALGHDIKYIYVWEDRNKEIITIEPFIDYFEKLGVSLIIYKIESDARD